MSKEGGPGVTLVKRMANNFLQINFEIQWLARLFWIASTFVIFEDEWNWCHFIFIPTLTQAWYISWSYWIAFIVSFSPPSIQQFARVTPSDLATTPVRSHRLPLPSTSLNTRCSLILSPPADLFACTVTHPHQCKGDPWLTQASRQPRSIKYPWS